MNSRPPGRERARRGLAAISPPFALIVAVSLGALAYAAFAAGRPWLGAIGCLGAVLVLFEGWQNRKSGRAGRADS